MSPDTLPVRIDAQALLPRPPPSPSGPAGLEDGAAVNVAELHVLVRRGLGGRVMIGNGGDEQIGNHPQQNSRELTLI